VPECVECAEHCGDEQQLADFHADVEEQQRKRDGLLRQAEIALRSVAAQPSGERASMRSRRSPSAGTRPKT